MSFEIPRRIFGWGTLSLRCLIVVTNKDKYKIKQNLQNPPEVNQPAARFFVPGE